MPEGGADAHVRNDTWAKMVMARIVMDGSNDVSWVPEGLTWFAGKKKYVHPFIDDPGKFHFRYCWCPNKP